MSGFKCIPGEQLTLAATTIAIAISKEIEDNDDLNILSGIFSAIGDNLGIIASQRQACPSKECEEKQAPL